MISGHNVEANYWRIRALEAERRIEALLKQLAVPGSGQARGTERSERDRVTALHP